MYYDHRTMRTTTTKVSGDVPGSANTENGGGVCTTDGSIPLTKTKSEKPRNRA